MKDKREIKQIKVLDEENKLAYVKIPNYRVRDYFMSDNELRFFDFLLKIVKELNEKSDNYRLCAFPQVALNMIIKQNNRREYRLSKEIFKKSIDFTIFDKIGNRIVMCIELDGKEHLTDKERIRRDKLVDKAFKDCLFLKRQPVQDNYDIEEYRKLILNELNKKESDYEVQKIQ